ncbi:VOC family protein [Erwinia billingiae]|jgi:hypothetical protein|uniref:VOC family protein n=1 Tax=Erwinia billingiae TaxID=182337 RepID=UPI0012478D45|nr:VOC family protein [Erwinia billingiae]QEW32336.1 VOC family protein [Erwinia billingiae]
MPVPTPKAVLDHVVINVADQLDAASALYRRLGFQLTERGHHSLGSSNHLAIFGENYLELLGYEKGKKSSRADLWQASPGLSGLVWKTEDADQDYKHLLRQDLDGDEPASFHRPVTLPDGTVTEAKFRTVRVRPSLIADGRSFFCQHLTPEAVWQPAWQQHPNGVKNISEFVIVARDPASVASLYSRLFGTNSLRACQEGAFLLTAGVTSVRFATEDYVRSRFHALPDNYDGSARMAALSFQTEDLAKVRAALHQGDLQFSEAEGAIVVLPQQGFDVALRFHQ